MDNDITIRDLVQKFGGVEAFCKAVSTDCAKLTPVNVYKFQMANEISSPWGHWVNRAVEANKIDVDRSQLDRLIAQPFNRVRENA